MDAMCWHLFCFDTSGTQIVSFAFQKFELCRLIVPFAYQKSERHLLLYPEAIPTQSGLNVVAMNTILSKFHA